MGINNALYKSLTFGVSALYTGVAGALGAHRRAVRRARQLRHLPVDHAPGRHRGRRAGLDLGRVLRGAFIQFVPNIADQISKAAPWAIYGVFLIVFMYVMPTGVAGAVRLALGHG